MGDNSDYKELIKKEPTIKLDLTDIVNKYPEVFEELAIQAEQRMRPIEHHALWLIKTAMDMKPIGQPGDM